MSIPKNKKQAFNPNLRIVKPQPQKAKGEKYDSPLAQKLDALANSIEDEVRFLINL